MTNLGRHDHHICSKPCVAPALGNVNACQNPAPWSCGPAMLPSFGASVLWTRISRVRTTKRCTSRCEMMA